MGTSDILTHHHVCYSLTTSRHFANKNRHRASTVDKDARIPCLQTCSLGPINSANSAPKSTSVALPAHQSPTFFPHLQSLLVLQPYISTLQQSKDIDPDDILASIFPAGALSSDILDANINNDAAYVPEISVQSPIIGVVGKSSSHSFLLQSQQPLTRISAGPIPSTQLGGTTSCRSSIFAWGSFAELYPNLPSRPFSHYVTRRANRSNAILAKDRVADHGVTRAGIYP